MGDAGIKLSGGQRQRLAIARAIVKRPKILILDEATSSIDVRGEQMVQAALDKVSKNRTTLMIAHRLTTVKKADNIVVLRKGQVVQQGTHDDLMSQEGGAYWTLATAQQLHAETEVGDEYKRLSHDGDIAEKKSMATIGTDTTLIETTTSASHVEPSKKSRGFWRSFGLLLREQSVHWRWYIVLLLSSIGGGGKLIPRFIFGVLAGCTYANEIPYNSKSTHTSLLVCNRAHSLPVLGPLASSIGKLLELDVCHVGYLRGNMLLCVGLVNVDHGLCKF